LKLTTVSIINLYIPFLQGRSLEITLTVPLNLIIVSSFGRIQHDSPDLLPHKIKHKQELKRKIFNIYRIIWEIFQETNF